MRECKKNGKYQVWLYDELESCGNFPKIVWNLNEYDDVVHDAPANDDDDYDGNDDVWKRLHHFKVEGNLSKIGFGCRLATTSSATNSPVNSDDDDLYCASLKVLHLK